MRFRVLTVLCLAMLLVSFTAMAADVTGTWKGEMAGRGGQTRPVSFTLKADGSTLTGTTTGRGGDVSITDGKVDGDNISFTIKREFNGNSVVQKYTGKVSGDEIKLKVEVEGMDRPPVELTLKRSTT